MTTDTCTGFCRSLQIHNVHVFVTFGLLRPATQCFCDGFDGKNIYFKNAFSSRSRIFSVGVCTFNDYRTKRIEGCVTERGPKHQKGLGETTTIVIVFEQNYSRIRLSLETKIEINRTRVHLVDV